jgi:hypothetical protein
MSRQTKIFRSLVLKKLGVSLPKVNLPTIVRITPTIWQGDRALVIFYAAVQDDPLDSGGRIIEGGSCGTIKGDDGRSRRLAFLGQKAWCDACNSAGVIVAAPGSPSNKRLYDQQRARQQALSGDLVVCKCDRHPRIVSVYGRKCKIEGDLPVTPSSVAVPASLAIAYDDRFVLLDADGNALIYRAYAVRRKTGAFEYGQTDGNGHTHLLSSAAAPETINLYLAG